MNPLIPVAPFDAAAAARALDHRVGPLSQLAGGELPRCFARLRLQLIQLEGEAQGTAAMLAMPDGPDDALWERGRDEMSDIISSLRDLTAWVNAQTCVLAVCECRADRLLRHELRKAGVLAETGRDVKSRRAVCVLAGYLDGGAHAGGHHVQVHYRTNIEHAVRVHGGWEARLVTDTGAESIYRSPGYPRTPLDVFPEDTLACVEAVTAALRR